ncbi:DNA polymerase III subunit gamma/tau [Vibrio rumoiensis]|uniref:DNA polymerase III subunit gamma/tau n=1 Tax=Vibrio rumoiensis 1S-45 TaxID=1188252 RepID=A0A1E5E1K5_9VIBR|nr:DNA polymerase III subunit gamma/tau [Vibrio rumoiensis]OEF25157.1 DNA polymerase III subunit gamma/tau [Vibrio rumoiensis 1S-45]
MSYLALARKWRPTKFENVVGQSHVITALENALKQNRLHHAYLFSGTRGVGKTSIGRLFAKGLNCETGITDNPCGVCDSCVEIDQGRYVDLLEIDAASRTKVEDTRELLDNVQYKPARGRFKVYLIDEVHMLSRHSFNALLKTLEEPPEYVKFLLATTDPQKLPVTILSRCLQFHLKPISSDQIHEQLNFVLGEEKITSEARALSLIAHAADGSMRDALSLSDQAIALGNGHVDSATVANMLGTLDTEQALLLLEAISSKQPQVAMDCLNHLASNGIAWDGLLKELSAQLHRIAMYQALPASLDKEQPDAERVELLSQSLSPQDVQLYYQMTLKGRQDLSLSPSEKMAAEMLVLRMLAFRPAQMVNANPIVASAPQTMTVPVMESKRSMVANTTTAQPSTPMASQAAPPVQNAQTPRPMSSPLTANPIKPQPRNESVPVANQMDSSDYSAASHAPKQALPSAEPQPAPSKPSEASASPLTGLRHQLRSKRENLRDASAGNDPLKKGNATSVNSAKTSVLDRIASKHTAAAVEAVQGSPISSNGTPISGAGKGEDNNEPYQWKPSQPEAFVTENNELTPTQIKRALEHVKTPEMIEKLLHESVEQDPWSAIIQKLNTPKLVEQLALNSTYVKQDETITLILRSEQAHLNTPKAQQDLVDALSQHFQQTCELVIQTGEGGITPLELREKLYQDKLKQAFESLAADPNIQFFQKRFAADIDNDSVRPV